MLVGRVAWSVAALGSSTQAGVAAAGARPMSSLTGIEELRQLARRNLDDVPAVSSEIWGTRNPAMMGAKRSGWNILRKAMPIGELVNAWYMNSLWEEGVPRYQEERHFIRKEELAYRRLKGKSVPPRKGEGKRKTKTKKK